MSYVAKDFSKLLGMEGLSDTLLNNHFGLYQGYVTNTNKVLDIVKQMLDLGNTSAYEYGELKRRLGWEFNGMRLHELYFENLGGNGELNADSKLAQRFVESFGSVDAWITDFKATGAMRGIGWVILYEDMESGKLMNFWINEHDVGHPAGCNPLLVMDVFEHAYMVDYGTKKAGYIDAFFKNVNWEVVNGRLKG